MLLRPRAARRSLRSDGTALSRAAGSASAPRSARRPVTGRAHASTARRAQRPDPEAAAAPTPAFREASAPTAATAVAVADPCRSNKRTAKPLKPRDLRPGAFHLQY